MPQGTLLEGTVMLPGSAGDVVSKAMWAPCFKLYAELGVS